MMRVASVPGVLAMAAILGACSSAPPGGPTVITLGLDQSGQITVSQETARVPIRGAVEWRSDDQSAVWVVVLADSTPMAGQQRTFNGGGTPAQARGAVGSGRGLIGNEYKYWVFYPDGNGGYVQKDPKLVIIADQGMDSTSTQ